MNVEGDDSNKTFFSCIFSAEKNQQSPSKCIKYEVNEDARELLLYHRQRKVENALNSDLYDSIDHHRMKSEASYQPDDKM